MVVRASQNKQAVGLAGTVQTNTPNCRQIVAYANGDRSEQTCRLLWERVPKRYKKCLLFTDFWKAYAEVLPPKQHWATGKGERQTCHIERFNNTLRQRLGRFVWGRFVRKTLSFSKTDAMHENCLLLFLHDYNANIQDRLKYLP